MGITFLFVFHSLCCCCFFYARLSISITPECHSADFEALQRFANLVEPPFQGWDPYYGSSCCTWKGVTCNFDDSGVVSRVVALELPGQSLGGKVPESLADLVHLTTLNLSANLLTGSLPPNVFLLQHLQVLDLSSNYLSGHAPFNINSSSIKFINISTNGFTGIFDPRGLCRTAKQIKVLDLSSNMFQGNVPSGFGNCSSLEHLSLASNSLFGNLPQDLFALSRLRNLDLSDNGFSGELSFQIGNLSNLVFLDISSNRFSKWLPDVFFHLRKLEQFAASSNNFTGVLPVSLCNSPTISSLSLDNNSFSDSINAINCSAMVRLTSLNLGSNHFVGNLGSLSSCHRLRIVVLSRNCFDGDFPDSFKNLKSLYSLSMSSNGLRNLSAVLTTLQHCRNLTILHLKFNFYGEVMPFYDSNFRFDNIRLLFIANCGLTGSIPPWLSSSPKLQILDLSGNALSGEIPSSIAALRSLFYLDLSNNSLSGRIPSSFTQFQTLVNFNNTLKEDIIEGFRIINKEIRNSWRPYVKLSEVPPSLYLGYNELSGSIWPEFGNLKELHVLDLSNNKLSGQIPTTLSKLMNLEILDLSYNDLTGPIPASLQYLHFLWMFNVSHNQLQGRVPSNGQFQTFPSSSFEGNDELRGFLTLPCEEQETGSTDEGNSTSEDEEEGFGSLVRAPLGIGVAFGFVTTVFWVLMFSYYFPQKKKKKRFLYY